MRLLSVSAFLAAMTAIANGQQQARIQTYHYDQKDCSNASSIIETRTVQLEKCYTDEETCKGPTETAIKTCIDSLQSTPSSQRTSMRYTYKKTLNSVCAIEFNGTLNCNVSGIVQKEFGVGECSNQGLAGLKYMVTLINVPVESGGPTSVPSPTLGSVVGAPTIVRKNPVLSSAAISRSVNYLATVFVLLLI